MSGVTEVDVEQLDLLPPAKASKVTERDMLDLLNARYPGDDYVQHPCPTIEALETP